MQLFYGTSNTGKFADVKQLIEQQAPAIELCQFPTELTELQTMDQRAIAIHKGRQAWDALKKPVFVDDSGFYIEKYYEFPGVLSKFVFQGLGSDGLKRLIDQGDRAFYKITLVFFYGDNQYHVWERKGAGTITLQDTYQAPPSLPFDAIFIPDGATQTLAELRIKGQFNQFDHRMHIITDLINWLQKHPLSTT